MIIQPAMAAVLEIIFMLMIWQQLMCWQWKLWLTEKKVQSIILVMEKDILLKKLLIQLRK